MCADNVSVSLLLVRIRSEIGEMLGVRPRAIIELAISNCGDGIQAEHVERWAPLGLETQVLAARTGLRVDVALDFASKVASEFWETEMFLSGELIACWHQGPATADLVPYIRVFESNAKRGLRGQPRGVRPKRAFREMCDSSDIAFAIISEAEAGLAVEGAKLAAEKPNIFTGDELYLPSPSKQDLQLLDRCDPLSKLEALHWLIDTLQSLNERQRSAGFVAWKASDIWCNLVSLRIHRQPKWVRSYLDGSLDHWADNTNLTVWDEIDILIRRFRKLPVSATLLISRQYLSESAWLLVAGVLQVDPYDTQGPFFEEVANHTESSVLLGALCLAREKAKHPSRAAEYKVVRHIKFAWEGLAFVQGTNRKTRKHCAHLVRTISDRFGSSLPSDEPLRERKVAKERRRVVLS